MPITQDRFIAFINAFSDMLDAWDNLRDFTQVISDPIVNINSAIEHMSPSSPEREAMQQALAALTQVHATIIDNTRISANHRAAVAVEREHFRKAARRNAKMAFAQRQARINERGSTAVNTRQQGPVHKGLPTTVAYHPHIATINDLDMRDAKTAAEEDYEKFLANYHKDRPWTPPEKETTDE